MKPALRYRWWRIFWALRCPFTDWRYTVSFRWMTLWPTRERVCRMADVYGWNWRWLCLVVVTNTQYCRRQIFNTYAND